MLPSVTVCIDFFPVSTCAQGECRQRRSTKSVASLPCSVTQRRLSNFQNFGEYSDRIVLCLAQHKETAPTCRAESSHDLPKQEPTGSACEPERRQIRSVPSRTEAGYGPYWSYIDGTSSLPCGRKKVLLLATMLALPHTSRPVQHRKG